MAGGCHMMIGTCCYKHDVLWNGINLSQNFLLLNILDKTSQNDKYYKRDIFNSLRFKHTIQIFLLGKLQS